MHFYRNTTERTIILDGHGPRPLIDGDGDGTDMFGVERVAVNSIDQDFIKDLQEGWGILEVLLGELFTVEDPVGFCTQLNWTDIGVGSLQNVFDMGEFLNAFHDFLL
jgi:hypothetical protein